MMKPNIKDNEHAHEEADKHDGHKVVVGGLASSTLLTLFVLPVLYNLFSRGVQQESR